MQQQWKFTTQYALFQTVIDGIDGICPQHLKDLVAKTNSDAAPKLLQSITKLENLMLSGKVLSSICPIIYGATLCALSKKMWRFETNSCRLDISQIDYKISM